MFNHAGLACMRGVTAAPLSLRLLFRPNSTSASSRLCSSSASAKAPSKSPKTSPTIAADQSKMATTQTGWDKPIPSQKGGSGEPDFIHKPPYDWQPSDPSKWKTSWRSRCYCKRIEFEYMGVPFTSKYCHCRNCQRMHGAPFQHAAIYPKQAVRMSKNDDDAMKFWSSSNGTNEHDVPCKISCTYCGSHLFDEGRNTVLAFPPTFNWGPDTMPAELKGKDHIFYKQRSIDVKDGLPKWAGHVGDGEQMPESEE